MTLTAKGLQPLTRVEAVIGGWADVTSFGAKGDGIVATVSMTASSAVVTATTAVFTSTAVDAGKLVDINGAGPTMTGNARYYGTVPPTDIKQNLVGKILTVTSPTVATLTVSASTAVSGKQMVFGTNDRVAIQAAISSSSKVVYFPKGKYIVGTDSGTGNFGVSGAALTITNGTTGLTLKGDGPFTSEIYSIGPRAYDTGTVFHILNVLNGCSGITFKDLGMSGTNALGELSTGGVDLADGVTFMSGVVNSFGITQPAGGITDIVADNCRFDHFWGIGYHAPGSSFVVGEQLNDFAIINCWARYNTADGFNPNICDRLLIANCFLTHNGTGGIETNARGPLVISSNVCQYNRGVGISVNLGPSVALGELLIVGNTVSDNGIDNTYSGHGIHVADQPNFSIVGNTVLRNSAFGIQASGGTALSENGLIAGNLVANNGLTGAASATGIILSDINKCVVSGNDVYNTSPTGYAQTRGIQNGGGSGTYDDGNVIIGNRVKGHATADYYFNNADNTFFDDPNPTATFAYAGTNTFIFPAPDGETALTITSNTIAPTRKLHSVGAGLIKTITVPNGAVEGAQVVIRPTAAFTTDLTGNVGLAITAVIGKIITFTYAATKWWPSYSFDAAPAVIWARVFHSTTQSLTSGTVTALNFDSERWDTDTIHDNATNNTRLTCKTAGVYDIKAHVSIDFHATGLREVAIRLNGGTLLVDHQRSADANVATRMEIATSYRLAVNDYVECLVVQNSGGALNSLQFGNIYPEFMMTRIGD